MGRRNDGGVREKRKKDVREIYLLPFWGGKARRRRREWHRAIALRFLPSVIPTGIHPDSHRLCGQERSNQSSF